MTRTPQPCALSGATGANSWRGVTMAERHPPTTEHNYIAKVLKLAAQIPRGSLEDIDIYHDDWCDLLANRGYCNCNPDVKLRPKGVH
jgi:hypothetical protein